MGKIQDGKLLYHLTKLTHLESIIANKLTSRRLLIENKAIFEDVADSEIMDKRKLFGLDKYIPFHFHPYSSFDVAVKNSYPNDEFIYICIERALARAHEFLILPKHPLSGEEVQLLKYEEGILAINWEVMEKNQPEPGYDKQVRMAECLTDKMIPVECFNSIAVRNNDIENVVIEKISRLSGNKPHVDVRPWF